MKPSLRNLAYAAVILAALSVVLHEMSTSAGAQTSGSPVVGAAGDGYTTSIFLADGSVYQTQALPGAAMTVRSLGNWITAVGPTATTPKSWGNLKSGH